MNFLAAEVSPNGDGRVVHVSGGVVHARQRPTASLGRDLLLGIRAEAIGVETEPGEGLIEATVIVVEPLGSHNLLTVRSGDDLLKVSTPPHLFPSSAADVWLRLEPGRIRWMDRGERARRSRLRPRGRTCPRG